MISRGQEALLSVLRAARGVELTTAEIDQALTEIDMPMSLSTIFITLDRMAKKGFVTQRKGDPLPERGGKARLYYGVTNTGRAALAQVEQTSASIKALKFSTSKGRD